MASVEEIRQSIQRRLDQVLDETDRLRAAINALGGEDRERERARGRDATRPAVQTSSKRRIPLALARNEQESITARRGDAIEAAARPGLRDGDQSAPATVRDRMLSHLRRELTAGLRTT